MFIYFLFFLGNDEEDDEDGKEKDLVLRPKISVGAFADRNVDFMLNGDRFTQKKSTST